MCGGRLFLDQLSEVLKLLLVINLDELADTSLSSHEFNSSGIQHSSLLSGGGRSVVDHGQDRRLSSIGLIDWVTKHNVSGSVIGEVLNQLLRG